MARGNSYSDDELLEDLRRVADKVGESPTAQQYHERGKYAPSTFGHRFGSWNEAKVEAGLSPCRNGGPEIVAWLEVGD